MRKAPATVVGAVVRFTGGDASVDVTIGEDNPTVRDFLSAAARHHRVEEFNGREKMAYFSRKLATEGSPGSDPKDEISSTSSHGAISASTTTRPASTTPT